MVNATLSNVFNYIVTAAVGDGTVMVWDAFFSSYHILQLIVVNGILNSRSHQTLSELPRRTEYSALVSTHVSFEES